MSNQPFIMPSSEADRKQIAGVIKEISDALTRKQGETDYINEAKGALREDWGFSVKELNAVVNMYYNQNKDETEELFDSISEIYTGLPL